MSSRSTLREQLRGNLHDPLPGTLFTDAVLNGFLDLALSKVSKVARMADEISVLTSTAENDWPSSGNVRTLEVRRAWWNTYPLSFVARFPDATSTGTPVYARLTSGKIVLWPAPAAQGTLRLSRWKYLAGFLDDSTDHGLEDPLEADEAIVAYATYKAKQRLPYDPDLAAWLAEYQRALNEYASKRLAATQVGYNTDDVVLPPENSPLRWL